jgi:hypothetical protein
MKADRVAYNTKNKANRSWHKTARKGAMGLYLYVAIWGSRAANWIKFFFMSLPI